MKKLEYLALIHFIHAYLAFAYIEFLFILGGETQPQTDSSSTKSSFYLKLVVYVLHTDQVLQNNTMMKSSRILYEFGRTVFQKTALQLVNVVNLMF